MLSLFALFFPAVGFSVVLLLGRGSAGCPDLLAPASWPVELWIVAAAGTVATVAGYLDHRYHVIGGRAISRKERASERLALAVGGVLFGLMLLASTHPRPHVCLLPAICVALFATVLICYDEFTFHRRCTRYEALLHRALVFGNGAAWLAWCHWCFVRPGGMA